MQRRPYLVVLVAIAAGRDVAADPLRLRGDALASAQAPAGLMTLEASDRARPWLDAEASVWFGAGDDTQANALIVVVKLRDPKRRGALRVGRQIVSAGALRPVHLDGVDTVIRLPAAAALEVFGGVPVELSGQALSWDWVAGARASQKFGDGQFGVAWLQRRDAGLLDTHELAADGWQPLSRTVDVHAAAAMDIVNVGLAELRGTATWRGKHARVELFCTQRAPSHLMPATSLFSVLGDVAATRTGTTARWQAAPRLDVDGTAALRIQNGGVDEDVTAGARLRLDDAGASSLRLELRRQGSPDGAWTGARGAARYAVTQAWTASSELELVRPDRDTGRGTLWPWALGAVTWRPASGWELAAAVEASATPQYRSRLDVLVRLSRAWEAGDKPASAPRGALARRGVP